MLFSAQPIVYYDYPPLIIYLLIFPRISNCFSYLLALSGLSVPLPLPMAVQLHAGTGGYFSPR